MLLRADPGHEHDLDALVPARPDRQRSLPGRPHVPGADQRGLLLLRARGDARDRALAHRPADPLPDHGQLPGLPGDRRQARRSLDGRRPPLLQPERRRLRDDQPLARLPEARRLAGARLRSLPAHRLRPLPPRASAALRQRRQAGGQRALDEPEDGPEAPRGDAEQRRDRPEEGRALRQGPRQLRVLRLRAPVREFLPGQDRRARSARTSCRPTRRTSRPRFRSSCTPTSTPPQRRRRRRSEGSSSRRTARARRRSPSSS